MADSPSNSLKRPHPPDDLHNAQKKIRSADGSPAPQQNGKSIDKPDVSAIIAKAKARAAAIAAKMGTGAPSYGASSPAPSGDNGAMSRAAQMKARVQAAMARTTATSEQRTALPSPLDDTVSRARGGLGIGLHPSLLDSHQGSSKTSQATQSKAANSKGGRQTPEKQKKNRLDLTGPDLSEVRSNIYFDASLAASTKARNRRELSFNQKGKYVQQAAALRREAALQQLKQKIAANTRKAGLDDQDPSEKSFKIEEPPAVEWWNEEIEKIEIDTDKSIITAFVQHPVLIEPPSIKNMAPPKPLPLTKQEMAKKRRIERLLALKEVQAKQRLGLEEAPAPKVKLGNMMRVMGEEAVKDPTAVEAKVNAGIAERKSTHESTNESRKLTTEQKHEKLEEKQAQDASRGIHVAVFKVDSLANGRHKFKVNKNAEQMALTGGVYSSPKQTLIIAEGGTHSIQAYKKLMLQRIVWSENDPAPVREGNKKAREAWLQAEEEDGTLKDLSSNHCTLLWEGETKARAFKGSWRFKVCETDKEAIEALSRTKMENFWTQAKSVP